MSNFDLEGGDADHEEFEPFMIESSHPGNINEREFKEQRTKVNVMDKIEKYANAPAKAVQSITPYLGNNAPLRVHRLKARNRNQQRAHDHNSKNCVPTEEVQKLQIKSLHVCVISARNITFQGKQLLFSNYKPRTFKCIMSYEDLPTNIDQEEFRHVTPYRVMKSTTHDVTWNEEVSMGTVYSLDGVKFSIRVFLDTTFLALGKTARFGAIELYLRDLVDSGAMEHEVEEWYDLKGKEYCCQVRLAFRFVVGDEEAAAEDALEVVEEMRLAGGFSI